VVVGWAAGQSPLYNQLSTSQSVIKKVGTFLKPLSFQAFPPGRPVFYGIKVASVVTRIRHGRAASVTNEVPDASMSIEVD
jgi:hypothetical protein